MSKKVEQKTEAITIKPPNIGKMSVRIVGVSPLVQNKFSKKARDKMREQMEAGSTSKTKRKRDPRDFESDFQAAIHYSEDGWVGIPAPAFRNAMISACRVVGFKMTVAKLSVFVEADGLDAEDGTPLVKLIAKEPEMHEGMVRNATGVADIRVRPMWRQWSAQVRVTWDKDQFTEADVINLLDRAGLQVGIGEGRPDSKSSAGMGWGQFQVERGKSK